jgi:N-succinyl-L-ornithine transcarbamylase
MVMNFTNEGWTLEFEDGAIMNQGASEHIKEAAEVVSQYCDIIAIRAFAGLVDKEKRQCRNCYGRIFKICYRSCCKYGRGHPLQSLADAITMEEFKTDHRPRSFYPGHTKAPQLLILLCK